MCKTTESLKADFHNLGSIIMETIKENKSLKELSTLDLEGSDDIVYVTDMATNKILFVNSEARKMFGQELIGRLCYEVFQGLSSTCEFCTNEIILDQVGTPYHWVHYNEILQKLYLIIDIAKETNGKMLRFERAIHIKASSLKSITDLTIQHNLI